MLGSRTIAGHSLPLNWLFTTLNLVGLVLTAMAFHPAFAAQQVLFAIIGITVIVLSPADSSFSKAACSLQPSPEYWSEACSSFPD